MVYSLNAVCKELRGVKVPMQPLREYICGVVVVEVELAEVVEEVLLEEGECDLKKAVERSGGTYRY